MSSPTPTETDALLPTDLHTRAAEVTEAIAHGSIAERYHSNPMTTPVEVAGFWLAILLPFLYLPLLMTGVTMTTFSALVLLNVVALLAGSTHRRD